MDQKRNEKTEGGAKGGMTEKEFQQYKKHREPFYIKELIDFGRSLGVQKEEAHEMEFLVNIMTGTLRTGETSMVIAGVGSAGQRIRLLSNALALMLKQLDLEIQDRERLGVH
jgi:hypothetical protein